MAEAGRKGGGDRTRAEAKKSLVARVLALMDDAERQGLRRGDARSAVLRAAIMVPRRRAPKIRAVGAAAGGEAPPAIPPGAWEGRMTDDGKVIAADTAAPEPARVRISTWAYLRTMWTLLYEAFASPFTTSVIDATTGKLIERR